MKFNENTSFVRKHLKFENITDYEVRNGKRTLWSRCARK